jgi:cytosine/adenosine deaminase-related metal-dependent hydrolase
MRSAALLTSLALGASGAILYEGATIISFNETTERLSVLHDASLLIEGDTIAALSEGSLDHDIPGNTTRINATGSIISPGFIDTHTHLWQTAFKTIGSNTSLADYFQKFGEYGQASTVFTPEDLYLGQLSGSLERVHVGTTTVLDHAHASWTEEGTDSCVNGSVDSGVRTVYAHAIHQVPGAWSWEEQIRKLQKMTKDHRFHSDNGLLTLGLAYDGFFNAPASNISTLWNITKGANLSVVTTHHLGGPWGFTNSPTALHSHGWLNDTIPVVFSHSSFLSYKDAQLLRDTNQYISTTPESELHFGHVHPHANNIQDQASLGVDCHFTYSSSMVNQARLWLQTLRAERYADTLDKWHVPINSPMSVEQAFYLITRAGALALRRPDIGTIQVGSKADLVVYSTDSPNMLGWSDPVAAIILHADVGDIDDVLVNGVFVKRGGKLMYKDYASLRTRLTASAKRIQKVWAETEFPELEGFFQGGEGAPLGPTEIIDTLRGNGTGY